MLGLKLFHCYKTTFRPTGQMFFGIHCTDDMNFGTSDYRDPFVGSGARIKDLIQRGAKRGHFSVETLRVGTYQDCKAFYDRIVFDYNHPLCLNDKPGAPAGVPKTEEHRAAIGEALETAMVGNDNALGTVKTFHGGKLKWFHQATTELQLETVDGRTPVDSLYKGWELGRLPKTNARPGAKSSPPTVSTSDLK